MQTTTRLYDRYEEAVRIVQALEAEGIDPAGISLVAGHTDSAEAASGDPDITPTAVSAGAGEAIGAVIGGGAGLLAGLGILAIPGVGPVVAVGWLVATVTGAGAGAAAGSLLGALVGAGLSEEHARQHIEDIRRGAALVTVRADAEQALVAERIMDRKTR